MKKRIVHVQLLPLLSGVQNMMLHILENLDREKYEIFVISHSNGPMIEKLKTMKIEHIKVDSLIRRISFLDFLAFIDLFRIFRKYHFDIVHTHSSKTGFLGRIAARLAGVKKIVHTVHGFPFNDFQPSYKRSFFKCCERFAGSFCDHLVFVNKADRLRAIETKLIAPSKACTIYNGVELPVKVDQIKKTVRFIIGSSFRFWQQKNPIQTIRIAIEVCRRNEVIDFVFLGDGEFYDYCLEMVNSEQMQSRIKLPGWQANVNEWLLTFDVFFLFSKWEGLPISILEAMAAGLPIIASDITGNNELVSDVNGVLVNLNDVDKLIALLASLPKRKKDLKRWGKGSLDLVKNEFNLLKFVNSYQEIYDS